MALTLQQLISTYAIPKQLADLLTVLNRQKFNSVFNGEAGGIKFDIQITPNGFMQTSGNIASIGLPQVLPNVPVGFVDNKLAFAVVDIKTVLLHELSHIALRLMSATAKFELDTEFNVATLAAIVSDNSTPNNIDINSIIIDLQNNNSNPDSVSSYENAFNMGRHYYSKLTGTQEGDLFRTGYFADGDWASNTPDAYEAAKKNGWDIALIGNEQVNTLITGSGNDLLDGGFSGDTLEGGTGYDTYIAGDGDTIMDDDGKGIVTFEGDILSGGTLTESHELYDQYEGDGGTYYLLKTTNALIYQKGEQFLTIENYHKDAKSLGITLTDELPELTIIGHMANENDGTVTGKVVLTQAYGRDMIIHLSTLDDSAHTGEDYHSNNNITVTITAGETEGDFSVTLIDNQIVEGRETFFAQIDSVTDTSNQPIQYTIKDITPLTIEDDDGLNVSVFAPTVSENAGIATGAVTINKTQYDREVAA